MLISFYVVCSLFDVDSLYASPVPVYPFATAAGHVATEIDIVIQSRVMTTSPIPPHHPKCDDARSARAAGVITFRVKNSRGEMYIGHGRLYACVSVCLYVCLSVCPSPHSHTTARTGCNLTEW